MWRICLLWGIVEAQDALWLDPRKRLPDFEAARKKPGWVWTAYPSAGYETNRGLGFAIQANTSYNGSRQDTLFTALPYRHFMSAQLGYFAGGVWYGRMGYEWLWPKQRPYRLMWRADFRRDEQIGLWGLDARSLRYRLSDYVASGRFADYYAQLKNPRTDNTGRLITQEAFHRLRMERLQLWLWGERLLARGLLRVSYGLRYIKETPSSLSGTPFRLSKSQTAIQQPTLLDSLLRVPTYRAILSRASRLFIGAALIYDMRDFEVDPHRGIVMEAAQEVAPIGTVYKSHLSMRGYFLLHEAQRGLPRLGLAVHGVWSATYGRGRILWDTYCVMRWAEGRRLDALGGPLLLRGFRENRFVAPYLQIYQAELRCMLIEKSLLRQHFIGGVVTFADVGSGANTLWAWTFPWKTDVGGGVRILWNLQTILRADAAYSAEGLQLIFTTQHTF